MLGAVTGAVAQGPQGTAITPQVLGIVQVPTHELIGRPEGLPLRLRGQPSELLRFVKGRLRMARWRDLKPAGEGDKPLYSRTV